MIEEAGNFLVHPYCIHEKMVEGFFRGREEKKINSYLLGHLKHCVICQSRYKETLSDLNMIREKIPVANPDMPSLLKMEHQIGKFYKDRLSGTKNPSKWPAIGKGLLTTLLSPRMLAVILLSVGTLLLLR